MSQTSTELTFGDLLRQLRRRAGLTQRELAALVGFSISQISLLEQNERLPSLALVAERFAPALTLGDEPHLLQRLLELAAQARGERLPPSISIKRTVQTTVQEEWEPEGGNLPAALTPLLGRSREIDQAVARLTQGSSRWLTLLGPPGVGKTRLALAVAERVQPLFADGVRVLPLANIAEPEELAGALAAALGLGDLPDRSPQQRVVDFLRRRELLLVLDDFEHLLTSRPDAARTGAEPVGSRLLVQLLQNCPRLHLLVTSREPVRVRGEQQIKVQPLGIAAAVELFLRCAQAVDPEFAPPPVQLAAITEICFRLDCLPLAIELLASRIDLLTPTTMLDRLARHRLDLLSAGPTDLPTHQGTLRGTIWRSYALLDPAEQQMFRSLSVFAGGFDLPAVEALHPESTAATRLHSLVSKSLVKSSDAPNGEKRFFLLETVREFAGEQLADDEDAHRWHTRHLHHFLALATADHAGADEPSWSARLQGELDNLRSALRWAIQHEPAAAQRMVAALREFWRRHSHFREGAEWATQVLAIAPLGTVGRAGVLLTLGEMLLNHNRPVPAQHSLEEALALFRAAGDQVGVAQTLRELGWAIYLAHRQQASLPYFRASLDVAEQLDDPSMAAHALIGMAHVLVYEGSYTPELRSYIERGAALFTQVGDAQGLGEALLNLSAFHIQVGDYAAALQAAQRAEQVAVRPNNLRAWTCASLSELLLLRSAELDSAELNSVEQHLHWAYSHFQAIGADDGVLIVLHHMGELARKRRDWATAAQHFERSLAMAETTNNQRMVARCQIGLGHVALGMDSPKQAAGRFAAAQALLDNLPAFLPLPALLEYQQAVVRLGSP